MISISGRHEEDGRYGRSSIAATTRESVELGALVPSRRPVEVEHTTSKAVEMSEVELDATMVSSRSVGRCVGDSGNAVIHAAFCAQHMI